MRVFLSIVISWLCCAGWACAETVSAITIETHSGQTHVTISRQVAGSDPKIFELKGERPRVVIDWDNAVWDVGTSRITQSGHGVVQHVRYARKGDLGLRLVLDLAPGASLARHQIWPDRVTVTVNGQGMAASAPHMVSHNVPENVPYPRLNPKAQRLVASNMAATPRKPVIVIDPGHGGRDPGAIGRQGTYEKLITLNAGKELKRQLTATGRYDVILTRTGDKYIDHEERLRIARAGGADLFISIHADSTKSRTARGASVYTLADRAKNRSRKIVDTQNWIMDVDLTTQSDPVGDILVDLAQRKTTSQSEMFADILVSNLSTSTELIRNTHRRAGYFVLLAPDVPAVLLELGFISNSQDEQLLKSAAHRQKMMSSVVTAINIYFDKQKS